MAVKNAPGPWTSLDSIDSCMGVIFTRALSLLTYVAF